MNKNQKDLNESFLVACFNGNVEEIKKTLAQGADVNASAQDKTNGLLFAIMSENEQAALAVIEGGANVNKKSAMNITPLHMAAVFGQVGTAQALIAKGADINAIETRDGFTPLMSVIYYNTDNMDSQRKMVACLLKNGADVSKTSFCGLTAARLAKDTEVSDMLNKAATPEPVVKAKISVQTIQKRDGRQGR